MITIRGIRGTVGVGAAGQKPDGQGTTVIVTLKIESAARAISSRIVSDVAVVYDFADGSVSDPVVMSAVLYIAGLEAASWSLPGDARFLDSLSKEINEATRAKIETEVRTFLRERALGWERS